MKILVTGGGGFLGGVIVRKLLDRGDTVRSFSRSRHATLDTLRVEQVAGDLADTDAVKKACAGVDAVIHVASKVGMSLDRPAFYKTNVIGARNVLEGCRANGVKRLVYTSTPSVIFDGEPHGGIDETRPYPPKFFAPYPETKAVAEREVLAANGTGLCTVALRPHLIWGPGDPHLIPGVVRAARAGRMKIVGDGSNRSDIIYVDNAAAAHLSALDRMVEGSPVCGSAYFLSQGAPVNLWEFINTVLRRLGEPTITGHISFRAAYGAGAIAETIWRLLGKKNDPPMTRFMAMNLAHDHWFVIDKAKAELGYTPAVSTDEGLDRLARWWHEEKA